MMRAFALLHILSLATAEPPPSQPPSDESLTEFANCALRVAIPPGFDCQATVTRPGNCSLQLRPVTPPPFLEARDKDDQEYSIELSTYTSPLADLTGPRSEFELTSDGWVVHPLGFTTARVDGSTWTAYVGLPLRRAYYKTGSYCCIGEALSILILAVDGRVAFINAPFDNPTAHILLKSLQFLPLPGNPPPTH